MTLAVIIPWHRPPGPEGDHRARVWDYLRPRWEATGYDLIIGSDPLVGQVVAEFHVDGQREPVGTARHAFSVARATNNAARHAPDEVTGFALFGADHVPDPGALRAAEERLLTHEWSLLYQRIAYASRESTEQWLAEDADQQIGTWVEMPAPCTGVLAVRRSTFEAVGGMDERYEGWGYEDAAFVDTLARRAPGGPPTTGALRELWHHGDHRVLHGTPNERIYREARP